MTMSTTRSLIYTEMIKCLFFNLFPSVYKITCPAPPFVSNRMNLVYVFVVVGEREEKRRG